MSADRDRTWVGSMPRAYDEWLGPTLFDPFARDMAARVAALRPDRVLELAAGTGILTGHLVAALPDAAITATDLNPAMVEWGARAAPSATWLAADAQLLPFPDAAFDLVCCQFGVMFFPDRVGAYRQVHRVLRPGGRVLVSTWDTLRGHHFGQVFTDALGHVFPDDPPRFLATVPHGYPDPDRAVADLRAGGFDAVEVDTVTLTGHAASAAAVATGFCTGTPVRAELLERGDLAAATAAVADRMTALLGAGPVAGPMRAHVVRGTRSEG